MSTGQQSQKNSGEKNVPAHEHGPRPDASKADFETMVAQYLASNPIVKTDRKTSEMEVRFGTNNRLAKPISKIDYDNVVGELLASGFTTTNPGGLSILRIQNEYIDPRTGETKISNIRGEIVGVDLIQEYCKTNSIEKVINMPSSISASSDKIKFTQKSPPRVGDKPIKPVDMFDFNFRLSFQLEQDFTVKSNIGQGIINRWLDSKKLFRYINRVRFYHPHFPVFADLSIVKGSKKVNRVPIPEVTIQKAGVFTNQETYEIELEIDNRRVGPGTPYNDAKELSNVIRKCIRIVLGGLQGTHYPIAYSEREKVMQSYMALVHGPQYQPRRVLPRDFIGPSSYTLQLENIQPTETSEEASSIVPNIRKNYTVTDKADGDRALMFISENGRIYMIDTNMNVIFTGMIAPDKTLHRSLLDGEYIRYDKEKRALNLYAAFDIYYIAGESKRELGFVPVEEDDVQNNFRLPLLNEYVRNLKPISIVDERAADIQSGKSPNLERGTKEAAEKAKPCAVRIQCKTFYSDTTGSTIFAGCSTILSNTADGLYPYTTDGLIFTPTSTGVGSNRIGAAGPLFKTTWSESFKWKPPAYNTIDFLVSVKKDKNGKDEIHHIFQEGNDMTRGQSVIQYKTLVLRCGFDERKHGYLNPMLDMINDQLPSVGELDNEETYKPVAFQPTNPYDPDACLCNILLKEDGQGTMVMMTADHEYFEEDTIVEFSYDGTKEKGWKWQPLRVRNDKTSEFRSNMKNYGNAYHVANGNWHSIHNPITEEMITTGQSIPETTANEDVYYNRSTRDTSTKGLRDFHNLYVKRKLILGVSNRDNTLIDYAVGKAGDLPKWLAAKLSFVFGIDVSKDNIENHIDGACARFLNYRKKYKDMPGALFVHGNSGNNIRSGKALMSEKDREIARAIFGNGPKDRKVLGDGVYKRYGVGQEGFNVSSCQFAMHYFFENPTVFHQFLRNVAECTRIGGYYIATCYDGKTVFKKLAKKNRGEGMVIMRDEKKIYEIIKQYDQTGFPDDETSLGYAIDVYQESINKVFREYLVNYDYLVRIFENYGFVPISEADARSMQLPGATGLFETMFSSMENEVKRNPLRNSDYGMASQMSEEEKRISYMNRYFVFKKIRNVNVEKVPKFVETPAQDEEDEAQAGDVEEEKTTKPVARKLKGRKIVLDKYSPIDESPMATQPVAQFGKKVVIIRKPKKDT
jgi:hypothetical protein